MIYIVISEVYDIVVKIVAAIFFLLFLFHKFRIFLIIEIWCDQ